MKEVALQQRTVDRIALVGSALAVLSAAAFVALDPVQTVARHPAAAQAPVAVPAPVPESSPIVELALPSPAWTLVTDGAWAAYARLEDGQAAEVVARSLHGDTWSVIYRAAPRSYLGQLSAAKGVLVLEEIAPNESGKGRIVTIRSIPLAGGDPVTLDTFAPSSSLAASPATDGSRVFWVRPGAGAQEEIRELDLASGETRTLLSTTQQIAGLALHGDRLAYTGFTGQSASSYVLAIGSATARPLAGFAYSYVQSIAPDGVIVTGALEAGAPAASWFVKTDGTRTRLGSDCFNATYTERLLAMRCAAQIEIRDLATGGSLYRFAGNAGSLAVFENGVVWGEGDDLVLYQLPSRGGAAARRPN